MKDIRLSRKPVSGFALITALVLLIGLMLLGIAGMNMSIFDEKIAGNFATRNVTYQLAETALRQGEKYVDTQVTPTTFDAPTGHNAKIIPAAASSKYWVDESPWASAQPVTIPGTRPTLTAGFFVEEINESIEFAERANPMNYQYFRVTARAIDSVTGAGVTLQSITRRPRTDTPPS